MVDQGEGRKRRSITKLQRETAAAAGLISLCQTVTQDGRLEEREVLALGEWLDQNRGGDLPAIAFLLETVGRIIEDGKVTEDERRELYAAIETVLPPDLRESVKGTRLSVERAEKRVARDAARKEKEARRAALAEELGQGNSAEDWDWDFMVAGCKYDGRPEALRRFARVDDQVFLARDRANQYSRNAVEVRLWNGVQAGYVPEDLAVEMAPLLDSGHRHVAKIKKLLAGGSYPLTPVVVAALYPPTVTDAETDGAVTQGQIPARPRVLPPGPGTDDQGIGDDEREPVRRGGRSSHRVPVVVAVLAALVTFVLFAIRC